MPDAWRRASQLASIGIGVWLMAAPQVLGYEGAAADNHHVVGPLVASFACIALWDVASPVRRLNALLAAWLIAAPVVLLPGWVPTLVAWTAAAALIPLSLRGPDATARFGGGWSVLWRDSKGRTRGSSLAQQPGPHPR
jgi:MFS superfamily sulfate permease-like transporter